MVRHSSIGISVAMASFVGNYQSLRSESEDILKSADLIGIGIESLREEHVRVRMQQSGSLCYKRGIYCGEAM